MGKTEKKLESDSRFPSGEWNGFFIQPGSRQRFVMEMFLEFCDARMSGGGDDIVGKFTISGRYDLETGRCSWAKQYVGQHCVDYGGVSREQGIVGGWTIQGAAPGWQGPFFIWPRALGDLESVFERVFVEFELESLDFFGADEPAGTESEFPEKVPAG